MLFGSSPKAPPDPEGRTERDTYREAGCLEIWDYLAGHKQHPPSFEVFRHGYMQSMCGSLEEYAEVLVHGRDRLS